LAELHEAARHRALGRRAGLVRGWHRFLGAGIAPRRHACGDGSHRRSIERIVTRRPLEARQRQFALGRRACARSAHRYALAAQHDLTGGGAATHRAPPSVGHALGTAQRHPVGLHHRGQHSLASIDA